MHVRSRVLLHDDSYYFDCNKKKRETPWIVRPSNGDDAMAHYAPLVFLPRDAAAAQRSVPPRQSLFHRVWNAILEMRQRQVDREIARYLSSTGGKFTDSIEREIERRFLCAPSEKVL